MSSGAVAASDPGGGEPAKLVDVAMTEAAGEAAAGAGADAAEEVKVEKEDKAGGVAAGDDVQEGGDAAPAAAVAGDPLYATESAGMVSEEGCGDERAEGASGGRGGEEMVEAGAGGPQSDEAERKPAPAGEVAAAAAGGGQAAEAADSATSAHPEAESNKVVENFVSANPGLENKERGNGVAHCDEEKRNNVLGDVEGSSKIHEDGGAPLVDQPDDISEPLPQTHEQVPISGDNLSSIKATSPGNNDQCARYHLPPLDKGGFQVSDLVWGKVKSHPWWPGEIFDPSDASELALKHQKKGSHLVAYFGDNTFAWCDESQLKPFVTNYSQMEKQSSSDAFVGSVNNALEELSRRILSGMSCSCLPEELCDNGMSYMVENAGLKDGVTCSAVNRLEILKCFSPEKLLHYIKELSLFPGQGGDLLELVIACSQLTSFYRSKGCPELASFQTGDGWVEDGMDTSATQNVMVEEAVINEVHPTQDKPKRGRGRPRKHRPEEDRDVMEKKDTSNRSNDTAYYDTVEKQMAMDFDDFENLQNKKKRSLDSFEDSEKSSTPTGGSSFKIGECIRRAASQLTGSSSIVKVQNEPTVQKNIAEAENGEFDISSDDAAHELTVEKRAKRRRMHRNHTADPMELLSQLSLVATEPMNGHSSAAMIISYFSDYRNYVVSATTEANIVEKGTSRRGRKRRVLPSTEVETTDHMQDSYWSGLSLHNHPINDLRKASPTTRPRRRQRASHETYVPPSEPGSSGPKKQIQVIERSIIHVNEKLVDELKPTALVLSFGRSADVPSEMNLIKIFSRYGPLKETETEVHKGTNTVKVVFKKRVDAERAFSAAGKYGTFGPSLRSYRLVNMPFSLSTSKANNPEAHPEERGPELPGPSESEAPLDAMQVDEVNKTEKAEVVGEQSVEQVETTRQTQLEIADRTLISQANMVEKTGQIDAELTDNVDQIGTAAQAESVSEVSSEQISTIELPVEGLSEVAQSGVATGASNGGMIDEIHLGDAPNQALMDNTTNTLQMEAPSDVQTEAAVKQALHDDATNEDSGQFISDNMQANIIAEAPKQNHISGNHAVFEAVVELPTTAQVDTETDVADEPLEGEMISLEQGQISNDKPVEADSTEQKLGPELLKQASDEVPSGSKLEDKTSDAAPVVQGAVEQVKALSQEDGSNNQQIVENKAAVELSDEQVGSIQAEAVAEVSGGQIEVGRQTPGDESMADATTEHLVKAEETLESRAGVLEENIDNTAAVGLIDETVEGEITVGAPDEKMENKASAEALAGETKEGEIAVRAPGDRTEGKAIAEPISGETGEGESTVKAPDAETVEDVVLLDNKTKTAEETVENVEALDEKTTGGEKSVEDATIETPDDKTPAVEKTEDAMVDIQNEKTTVAERSAEGATIEAPPDERAAAAENISEITTVAAPDEKAAAAEKISEDIPVVPLDEKAAASEKTLEDTPVVTPDEKAAASEKILGDTPVAAPDGKDAAAEKSSEATTVAAPDEKTASVEKTSEDTTAVAPDEKAAAADKISGNTTVAAPAEKTVAAEKTSEDIVVAVPNERAAASEKTSEETTASAPDVQADASEQTG